MSKTFKRRTANRLTRVYKWLYNRVLKANDSNLTSDEHFVLVKFQTEFNKSVYELLKAWENES